MFYDVRYLQEIIKGLLQNLWEAWKILTSKTSLKDGTFARHVARPRRAHYTQQAIPYRGKCKCRARQRSHEVAHVRPRSREDQWSQSPMSRDDLLAATRLIDRYHPLLRPTRRRCARRRPTNNTPDGWYANEVSERRTWPDLCQFSFPRDEYRLTSPRFPRFRVRARRVSCWRSTRKDRTIQDYMR